MAGSSKDLVGNAATVDVAAGGKYPEDLYRYTCLLYTSDAADE